MARVNHPIDCRANTDVEVFWNGQWNRALYNGWEPITEDDFRQPLKGGKYHIVYRVLPYHMTTGKLTKHEWYPVHSSRVRPCK